MDSWAGPGPGCGCAPRVRRWSPTRSWSHRRRPGPHSDPSLWGTEGTSPGSDSGTRSDPASFPTVLSAHAPRLTPLQLLALPVAAVPSRKSLVHPQRRQLARFRHGDSEAHCARALQATPPERRDFPRPRPLRTLKAARGGEAELRQFNPSPVLPGSRLLGDRSPRPWATTLRVRPQPPPIVPALGDPGTQLTSGGPFSTRGFLPPFRSDRANRCPTQLTGPVPWD